ncbi:hypothetical protein TYRP_019260 [Tyrophagus putrescentiae]|nr:hypothetical protein TYRP_019260 [Tyrophagus putrescentiae]
MTVTKRKPVMRAGLQLTANSFRTLLWNLTINCILLYCLYFDDPFRLIEHSFQPPAEKPLLVMFSRYNSHYKYPLTYTLTIVYYHLFGRRIRKLLFEFEQQQQKSSSKLVTRSYKTSLVSFLAIFALLHLLFLVGYSIVISLYLNHSQSPPAALIALKWFTIYVNHFSTQFPLVAVHNILKSKSCTLERIHCSLQSPELSQISTAVELIKSCAQINEELCKLIAFPFLVFLFSNSLDSIGAICAAKVHLNLSILFYQSAVFGFLLHLARLEESSRANFRRIALVCRQPDSGNNC